MKRQDEEINHLKAQDVNVMVNEMKATIDTRITTLEKKIESIIEKKEEERPPMSYAKITSKHIEKNIGDAIRKEKQEEQLIRSTARNLIFHGIDESTDETEEETKIEDEEFIHDKIIGQRLHLRNIKITETQRIGKFTKEREDKARYRPIKVTFTNEEDKNTVLQAITKEKGFPYRVTEDLTKNERQIIKEWCKEAEKMNAKIKGDNTKWKVRGSPRKKTIFQKDHCKKYERFIEAHVSSRWPANL